VSARALDEYRAYVAARPSAATFTWLDLLAHRDVSNEIAQRLGVQHESPQAIVVRNGRTLAVLNHGDIRVAALSALLAG